MSEKTDSTFARTVDEFGRDLALFGRQCRRAPGFTLVAVLTIALGIAVNTSLFSVIYAVLLKPYPYAEPDNIWMPQLVMREGGGTRSLQMGDFLSFAEADAVAGAIAANPETMTLSAQENAEILRTIRVSAGAFKFLGVPSLHGRVIGESDYGANGQGSQVVVLSHKFWLRYFDGNPNAVGQTLTLNDMPYSIIGVMPPRFNWHTSDGVWIPFPVVERQRGTSIALRLKPGISKQVAEQQLYARVLAGGDRPGARLPSEGFSVNLNNFLGAAGSAGQMRGSLQLLAVAVGLLLLIACTNVANLQLARSSSRSQEFAIRLAMGAGRGRLVRQMLAESIGLSLIGGAAGLLGAFWLVKLVAAVMPSGYIPSEARIEINGVVTAFCASLSIITGVGFGILPALQSTRFKESNPTQSLGAWSIGNPRSVRTAEKLVVSQIALSAILLVCAVSAVRGFMQAIKFDPGFRPERVLMLRVSLAGKNYSTPAQRSSFSRELVARTQVLPGVVSVATGTLPGSEGTTTYNIPGQTVPEGARMAVNAISPEYFDTLGIPLKEGRNITAQEVDGAESVAVINESAARLWRDGVSPVGRVIQMNVPPPLKGPRRPANKDGLRDVTIVGIVGDVRQSGVRDQPEPGIFLPYTLRGGDRLLLVRGHGDPLSLLGMVRATLKGLDSRQPLHRPLTWEDVVTRESAAPRVNMTLFSSLALVALGLAAAGVYSVLSHNVAQRTREFGVRLAIGATRSDILLLIGRNGLKLLGIGLALGVGLSIPLVNVAQSKLVGFPNLHWVTIVLPAAVICGVAGVSCLIPAWRATLVNPIAALRNE